MNLFRLTTIIVTGIRFGLDEILVRAFAPTWFQRIWLVLMFWRPVIRTRGERLRSAFEYLGPLFVKFGQVLSTRSDIMPADIAKHLSELQDRVQPQPFAEIKKVMEDSYGAELSTIFTSVEEQTLGSASVAQVHKAQLLNGTDVAVKVLRPNIRMQVKRDVALMKSFAWLLKNIHEEGARLRPDELVEEFNLALNQEIDLLHEAANCNQLRRNFKNYEGIKIPKVYWTACTKEVMVMELLEGIPVDQIDDLKAVGVDLERLAKLGIEIFFTQVFRDSFFHADMHPGNLFVDKKGNFIVLDFGIVGSLASIDQEYLGANFLAFFNRDYRKVAVMHIEAGWVPADTSVPQFEAAIRAVCEPIFARPLREISFGKLLLQLFQVARRFNLIVQPQLILLQKTLLNIEGIGRELAPDLNLWDTAKPFLENWAVNQNSPKRLAKMTADTLPSLISLFPELPLALREQINYARNRTSRNRRQIRELRKSRRRWQVATVILIISIIFFIK